MELTSDKNEQDKRERARKRVKRLKGFFYNALAFVFVITALAVINYQLNHWRYMWFLWPVLGWGIALIVHAVGVFGILPFLRPDWEHKKIQQLMDEEMNQEKKWQ